MPSQFEQEQEVLRQIQKAQGPVRLAIGLAALAILIGAVALLKGTAFRVGTLKAAALNAQVLRIVDSGGKTMAEFDGRAGQAAPAIVFFDASGAPKFRITPEAIGFLGLNGQTQACFSTAAVSFSDQSGKKRISLGTDAGNGLMSLYDSRQTARLRIAEDENKIGMTVYNAEGKGRLSMAMQGEDPLVSFVDSNQMQHMVQ